MFHDVWVHCQKKSPDDIQTVAKCLVFSGEKMCNGGQSTVIHYLNAYKHLQKNYLYFSGGWVAPPLDLSEQNL